MTRKQRRASLILGGLGLLAVALALVLYALSDTIVFFHTPSEIAEQHISPGQRFRLGGLVKDGSLRHEPGGVITFDVTDTIGTQPVTYRGLLPDLFREGQGVVAEGRLNAAGVFEAETILAKHDEKYMPPEVAKALKEKGVWQETNAPSSRPPTSADNAASSTRGARP